MLYDYEHGSSWCTFACFCCGVTAQSQPGVRLEHMHSILAFSLQSQVHAALCLSSSAFASRSLMRARRQECVHGCCAWHVAHPWHGQHDSVAHSKCIDSGSEVMTDQCSLARGSLLVVVCSRLAIPPNLPTFALKVEERMLCYNIRNLV